MKVYKTEEEQRLVEDEEREPKREPKKKKRQLKSPAEERVATGRRGPRRRELTNYRRTLK